MNTREAEIALGKPLNYWEGQCYAAAVKLAPHAGGEPAYGHWIGPAAEGSIFRRRVEALGFAPHGWIEMPDASIVDPTRWAFEAVEPYLYAGPNDHYDRGGQVFLARNLKPPPAAAPDAERFKLDMTTPAWLVVDALFASTVTIPNGEPVSALTFEQAHWLAHLPLAMYGGEERGIYLALVEADLGALIPLDNRRDVLGR